MLRVNGRIRTVPALVFFRQNGPKILVEGLRKAWGETDLPDKHPVQMIFLLDSGYIRLHTAYPPPGKGHPEKIHSLASGSDFYAGLGLGWLEAQVAKRNCVLANQAFGWVQRQLKQLSDLERRDGLPPTFDFNRQKMLMSSAPIHGILKWGWKGMYAHNQLFLSSIFFREVSHVGQATLVERNKPFSDPMRTFEFEPRWFKMGTAGINGHYCALEEWGDPEDRQKHARRVAVFDSRTGEEVTGRLVTPLNNCAEIEQRNPVLKE